MNEIDEKLALYQKILELEDCLEIKHNPQILKQVWDKMNDYYCDLQQIRDEIFNSELAKDVEVSSIVDYEDIDEAEKKRQIEEAYKELEDIWEKEAEEKSDFYEEIPEPNLSYLDRDDDDFEDLKRKKTDGNRISIIKKDGNTINEETYKVIQSEDGKFGLYDIHFYQKGGFRVYKEYRMLFHKEFLINDIKSITFDKSNDQVMIAFRNWQRLSPNNNLSFDEMIFYKQFSHLYIDLFKGDEIIDQTKCLFDRFVSGLDLFKGFCSLADLEEGCAILMVNGNAYITPNLSYFYNESATDNFSQLSETLIFYL